MRSSARACPLPSRHIRSLLMAGLERLVPLIYHEQVPLYA